MFSWFLILFYKTLWNSVQVKGPSKTVHIFCSQYVLLLQQCQWVTIDIKSEHSSVLIIKYEMYQTDFRLYRRYCIVTFFIRAIWKKRDTVCTVCRKRQFVASTAQII